ncbi:MAG TPA: hypothetical protein VMU20_15275 [Candidatus Dormibacteraeota bacterium]|nr:hypothetical protein [Candidatus Dormibacteraeota bacterium]
MLVIPAAVPLLVVTVQAAREPEQESVALLCGGLAFVTLLVGLSTLYHHQVRDDAGSHGCE